MTGNFRGIGSVYLLGTGELNARLDKKRLFARSAMSAGGGGR